MEKDKNWQLLMKKFMKNQLTREENDYLDQLISEGRLDISDFEELASINTQLDQVLPIEPPATLNQKFYTMLGGEKSKFQPQLRPAHWFFRLPGLLQWSLPILLLLIGFIGGKWSLTRSESSQVTLLAREIEQLREITMLTLLDKGSTSDKLKAVRLTKAIPVNRGQITQALLQTLNHDADANVRIACIEALLYYRNDPEVRAGLISAIPYQQSPLVLLNLAEALQMTGSNTTIDQFKGLMNKNLPKEAIIAIESSIETIM